MTLGAMRHCRLWLSALCLAGLAQAATATGALTHQDFASLDLDASVLPNPERGWVAWSGPDLVASFDAAALAAGRAQGQRLAYCTVQIGAFRGTRIDTTFLARLQDRLDAVRAAGMKCVLLVAYDVYGGSGNDDTAANIVQHIGQLAPVLRANADVLPFVKAGFIGAYGEWWGSAHGNSCGHRSGPTPCGLASARRLAVRLALLAALHPLTMLQFRYPDDHLQWHPRALSEAQAFSGSPQSRTGLHNDCQLSGAADSGTWNGPVSGQGPSALRAYAAAMTRYTPYGGELATSCAAPHRTRCADALADGATFHLTYLKDSGDFPDYKAQWAREGCSHRLANLMGYRLQLDHVSHPPATTAGSTINVAVGLRNVGWARLFSPRHLVAQACQMATPHTCYTGTSPTDLRSLPPQATATQTVDVAIAIPADAATGVYDLRLSIPDIWPRTAALPAFALRFANAERPGQVWCDTRGSFSTGTTISVNVGIH